MTSSRTPSPEYSVLHKFAFKHSVPLAYHPPNRIVISHARHLFIYSLASDATPYSESSLQRIPLEEVVNISRNVSTMHSQFLIDIDATRLVAILSLKPSILSLPFTHSIANHDNSSPTPITTSNKRRRTTNGNAMILKRNLHNSWIRIENWIPSAHESNSPFAHTSPHPTLPAWLLSPALVENNEIWLWRSDSLQRAIITDGNKSMIAEEYHLGLHVNNVYILHSHTELHPKSCTALFGVNVATLQRRIIIVERCGSIEVRFIAKEGGFIEKSDVHTLDSSHPRPQWRSLLDFNDTLHSVHLFATPMHDYDSKENTGLVFVGKHGTVCVVWAFPSQEPTATSVFRASTTDSTPSPDQDFIVHKKVFHLSCASGIDSIALISNYSFVYTSSQDGHVRHFQFLHSSETKDVITGGSYYSYSFPQYLHVRVLPIARGVRGVCAPKCNGTRNTHPTPFYFVSASGKLVQMSLPSEQQVDQMCNQHMNQHTLEYSMDYSVRQLDILEQNLSQAHNIDSALSARIYEWNCALHIVRGIKASTEANQQPFECTVNGILQSSSHSTALHICIQNHTVYPLKSWSLIVLLQRLSTEKPLVKTISLSIDHLPVGSRWEQVCEHPSLGESYDPLQVTLFLAYSVGESLMKDDTFPASLRSRGGFCTEICSKKLTLLDFVLPVRENNILAHSHLIPIERSLSFRCVRALLPEQSFLEQIKIHNQSVQRVQLLVSSVVYSELSRNNVLPSEQFITSKNHLVHYRVHVVGQESSASYQLVFQSSNDEVLHYIYHALLAHITPLQTMYNQKTHAEESKQRFEQLERALQGSRIELQQLHNDVHDCIFEYKQNEHAFPLEEVQEQSVRFAQRMKELYSNARSQQENVGIQL